jgi:hypothetical protein
MSTADRTRDLIYAIATAYVDQVKGQKNEAINQYQIMMQVMNLSCGEVGGDSCEKCLLNFFTPEAIVYPLYFDNEEVISQVIKGACAGVCFCDVDVAQDMTVNLLANAKIIPPNEEEITIIVERVQAELMEKYGPTFAPTREQIIAIIEGEDSDGTSTDSDGTPTVSDETSTDSGGTSTGSDQRDLNTIINQSIVAIQIIDLTGNMKVRNVNMKMLIDLVMNAIAKNSINIVRASVQDSVDSIKTEVKTQVNKGIKGILATFKYYWIGLGTMLALSLLLLIGTYIYKAFRGA